MKSVGAVHKLAHNLAEALKDLSEVTQHYAEAMSRRPTYFAASGVRNRQGDDIRRIGQPQVQFMCLSHASTMFAKLAQVQESLSQALHIEFDGVDTACVLYFDYILKRNLEHEQEMELLQMQQPDTWKDLGNRFRAPLEQEMKRRLVEMQKKMPDDVRVIKGDPIATAHLKHFGKLTVKQSRFDLKIARHASTVASLVYAGLSDAIHVAGGEDSFGGLERWKPFLGVPPPRNVPRRRVGDRPAEQAQPQLPTVETTPNDTDDADAPPETGGTALEAQDGAEDAAATEEQVKAWRSAVLTHLAKLRETFVPTRPDDITSPIDYSDDLIDRDTFSSSLTWRVRPQREASESKAVRMQRSRHGFLATWRRARKEMIGDTGPDRRAVEKAGAQRLVKASDATAAPEVASAHASVVASLTKSLPPVPEKPPNSAEAKLEGK